MRIRSALLSVTVALLSVTAVAGTANAATTTHHAFKPDKAYMHTIKQYAPELLTTNSPSGLISLGKDTCRSLGNGSKVTDIYMGSVRQGLTPVQAKTVLLAAAQAYCPQHEKAVHYANYTAADTALRAAHPTHFNAGKNHL